MHYSAKRGLAIACCLSVSLSVCDIGGSGPNRLDILETTCTDDYPNIFAFRSPKAIHLFPWEHAGILGRLEVRYWSTKATIFLNRVKVQEKLLWRDYRNSPTLFRTVPSRSPTAFYSPRLGVRNPHPKTQNSNHCYLRNGLCYGLQVWPEHSQGPSEQKPIKNFGEKGSWAYPETAQFLGYPLSQKRVKLRTSGLAGTFTGSIRTLVI